MNTLLLLMALTCTVLAGFIEWPIFTVTVTKTKTITKTRKYCPTHTPIPGLIVKCPDLKKLCKKKQNQLLLTFAQDTHPDGSVCLYDTTSECQLKPNNLPASQCVINGAVFNTDHIILDKNGQVKEIKGC